MNSKQVAGGEEGTYPERCKHSSDATENRADWCDAEQLLRDLHGFDGRVQQWVGILAALRMLRFGFHGHNSSLLREKVVVRKAPNDVEYGRPSCAFCPPKPPLRSRRFGSYSRRHTVHNLDRRLLVLAY